MHAHTRTHTCDSCFTVLPPLAGLDADLVSVVVSAAERNALQTAVTFRAGRAALQDEQLTRLGAELPLDQFRLPQLFSTTIGPDELAVLTEALLAEIEALPKVES